MKPLAPVPERARTALAEVGVAVPEGAVQVLDDALQVTLEASAAVDYDQQLLMQWALCFGTLGPLAVKEVRIVNAIDGKPAVLVTATTEAIAALAHGELDDASFLAGCKIEHLLPLPQPLVADPPPPRKSVPRPLPPPVRRPRFDAGPRPMSPPSAPRPR